MPPLALLSYAPGSNLSTDADSSPGKTRSYRIAGNFRQVKFLKKSVKMIFRKNIFKNISVNVILKTYFRISSNQYALAN